MIKFFIIGGYYTGYRILKSALEINPTLKIMGDESYSSLDKVQAAQSGGFVVPDWTELFVEYDCIKSLAEENAVILCMTRHPYSMTDAILHKMDHNFMMRPRIDTVVSLMRSWLKDSGRCIKEKYGHFLQMDEYWQVRLASVYWLYKHECYLRMLEKGYNIHLVKYEDLIGNPQKTLMKLSKLLDVPYLDAMSSIIKPMFRFPFLTDEQIQKWGSSFIDKATWENRLTDKQTEIIYNYTNSVASKLGYNFEKISVIPEVVEISSKFKQKIRLVDDNEFVKQTYKSKGVDAEFLKLDITGKQSSKDVFIAPWSGEHYNDIELFKIKLYCDKNNWKLVVCGSLNHLPAFSLFADEVILCTNQTSLRDIYTRSFMKHSVPDFDYEPIAIHGLIKKWPDIIVASLSEISSESVIENFYDKSLLIRKSAFDTYEQLVKEKSIPQNIIMCHLGTEVSLGGDASIFNFWKENKDVFSDPVLGIEQNFQRDLLSKVGLNYLSIQILSSLFSGWEFVSFFGASRLFSVLPIRNILLCDDQSIPEQWETIRNLTKKRYSTKEPISTLEVLPWTALQLFRGNASVEQLLLLEKSREKIKWFEAEIV